MCDATSFGIFSTPTLFVFSFPGQREKNIVINMQFHYFSIPYFKKTPDEELALSIVVQQCAYLTNCVFGLYPSSGVSRTNKTEKKN
jgi:hypothetical protein